MKFVTALNKHTPAENKIYLQSLYDSESNHYLADRLWMKSHIFQREVKHVSTFLTKFSKNCVIVNVGCGPGALEKSVWGNFGNSTFVAMDISPEMTRLTKARVPGLDVIVADAEALPFKLNTVDVILSGRALKFFNVPRFLNQANKVLTEKGSLGLIYDCGDALWVRFFERLGIIIDGGKDGRTKRTSQLMHELSKIDFEVLCVIPISFYPQSLFNHVPASLYRLLAYFDKPLKNGRLNFIISRKIRKAKPIKKEENLEFGVFDQEEIRTVAR